MKIESPEIKDTLKQRLRRIEGQVRGVQKMLDDDRDCHEILQQFAAIRAAVQNASDAFMRTHARECLTRMDGADSLARQDLLDNLMDLMARAR